MSDRGDGLSSEEQALALATRRAVDAAGAVMGMASSDRPHGVIAALCQAVPAGEVEAWIAKAAPGDEFVYATGPAVPQGMASVCMIAEMAASGLVRTHKRRDRRGGLEHFAVRRDKSGPAPTGDRGGAGPSSGGQGVGGSGVRRGHYMASDHVHRRMMALLSGAANMGRPCPTNAELSAALGLKNVEAARYIFRQLVRVGKIRVEDHGPRMRRVVTIVSSGNSTRRGVAI